MCVRVNVYDHTHLSHTHLTSIRLEYTVKPEYPVSSQHDLVRVHHLQTYLIRLQQLLPQQRAGLVT